MKSAAARRCVRSMVCVAVLAALSFGAAAQNLLDFDDWMQRIDDGSQDLQRHIAARDRQAAHGAAREIEELYALMEKFFEKRGNAEDAVRWSREGREFASRAQADLTAHRFTSARRNALAIAHGCRDCHFNYKPL
ncbi:MAG TPA: hypothetical protein VFU13_12275 [Steroidobacteraceae bacterium]|nr:hypothetical protein [Steroidobacteraceae bacterium]